MSRPGIPPGVDDPETEILYFFLSYAHLGPLPQDEQDEQDAGQPAPDRDHGEDVDQAVDKFFTDLTKAVATGAGRAHSAGTGFYDRPGDFGGDDPFRVLSRALGRAQVFVPLYSRDYLSTSWTLREQEAFRVRMVGQGEDPAGRVVPVLWNPVPSWRGTAYDTSALARARELADDVQEYARFGMRALCFLDRYRAAYHKVLQRTASEIVRTVRRTRLAPSVVDLGAVDQPLVEDPTFLISVVAAPGPGESRTWHPYRGRQALPVGQLAVRTAERHGESPRLVEFADLRHLAEQNPVLALVDPHVLDHQGAESDLRRAFEDLPAWVRPMVVSDAADPALHALADRAQDVLASAVPRHSDLPHRPVERVEDPDDLETGLAYALAKARQAYLKYASYTSQTSSAPHASRPGESDDADGAPSERDHDEH